MVQINAFHRCVVTLGACLIGFAGCTGGTGSPEPEAAGHHHGDHDHGDHDHDHGPPPTSYAEAVERIQDARDQVQAAFAAGTPDQCDEVLHEVAELLSVLPEIAAETDMAKDDWQAVQDQSQHLFDQFMKIHDGFHGGGSGTDFDSVAGEINPAIDVLAAKAAAAGHSDSPPAGHADHDHTGHAHEHADHDHTGHAHGQAE